MVYPTCHPAEKQSLALLHQILPRGAPPQLPDLTAGFPHRSHFPTFFHPFLAKTVYLLAWI